MSALHGIISASVFSFPGDCNKRYLAYNDNSGVAYDLNSADVITLADYGLKFGDLPLNFDAPLSLSQEDLLLDLLQSDIGSELTCQKYIVALLTPARPPIRFTIMAYSVRHAAFSVRRKLGWPIETQDQFEAQPAIPELCGCPVITLDEE